MGDGVLPLKIIDIDQNTVRWHRERMIRPTASEFHRIVTPSGKLSDQRRRYMYELIFQRIYGAYACPSPETPPIQRGKRFEQEAFKTFRDMAANAFPASVSKGKFITTDDGKIGCSPDGIVQRLKADGTLARECLEIKVPDPWRHMMYSVEGPLTDHKPQLQGLMYVGEFELVYFFSYQPGMPCIVHNIERDEPYIEFMEDSLRGFVAELDRKEAEVRALGNYHEIVEAML